MIYTYILTIVPVALCVTVQAIVITFLLRRLVRCKVDEIFRIWPPVRDLIWLTGWLIMAHIFEIGIWAVYYLFGGAMPDVQSAIYFSSVTYTTVGYGDLVLPEGWRLIGGIEALTGILMCGLSTGFFFAIVNRMYQIRHTLLTTTERHEEKNREQ